MQSQLHLYQGQDGRDGRDGRRHEEARRDERDRWYQAARQMARPVGETKKTAKWEKKNITFVTEKSHVIVLFTADVHS